MVDKSALKAAITELRQLQKDFQKSLKTRIDRLEEEVDGALSDEPVADTVGPSQDWTDRSDHRDHLYHFIASGDMRPIHTVLDVGCGMGRVAEQLTGYLTPPGRYEGFDVRANVIAKLQKRPIGNRYPHFRFRHADVYNKRYNPDGSVPASEYVFPCDDGTFDFVFAFSVFTHMFPSDMEHYLAEISRVLKTGRRCLLTYFLLNEELTRLIDAGTMRKTFRHRGEHYRYDNEDFPENALAVDESFVRQMYARHRLKILEPVRYGSWCGRVGAETRQNMVVAVKE